MVITSTPGGVTFCRSQNLQSWGDGWDEKGEENGDEEEVGNLSSLGLGWGRLELRNLVHVTGDVGLTDSRHGAQRRNQTLTVPGPAC